MINSLLDNDVYKFFVSYFAFCQYPDSIASYKLYNRGKPLNLTKVKPYLEYLERIKFEQEEIKWLGEQFPWFSQHWLEWLEGFRFKRSEVTVSRDQLTITSPWYRTTLWEVVLMSLISELNNEEHGYSDITAVDNAFSELEHFGIDWADFGTRRRQNSRFHDEIVRLMSRHSHFKGTSNLFLAKKYRLKPIGSVPHELSLFSQTLDIEEKNSFKREHLILKQWFNLIKTKNIYLPDTISTELFLKECQECCHFPDGYRIDSGDEILMTELVLKYWDSERKPEIIYSNSLNPKKAIEIYNQVKDKVVPMFGIGTALTNSIHNKPCNFVIKLDSVDGKSVVKLSEPGKETGDPELIKKIREIMEGIEHDYCRRCQEKLRRIS